MLTRPAVLTRLWRFTFLGHALVAGLALWLLPKGFELTHLKFWANSVFVWLLLLSMVAACYADFKQNATWLAVWSWGVCGLWFSGGLTALGLFPQSMFFKSIFAMLLATLGIYAAIQLKRTRPWWGLATSFCSFAAVGCLLVLAQRALPSATQPFTTIPLPWPEEPFTVAPHFVYELSDSPKINVYTDKTVTFEHESLHLKVQPLLTFTSRSPDRCWTNFASSAERMGAPRRLLGTEELPLGMKFFFGPQERSLLEVISRRETETLQLEAYTELRQDVFSHLNGYCSLWLHGHQRLHLEFSPCPGVLVEPMPNEYPFGMPLRLGFLTADGNFRVVEAQSAEKGPFRTLAEGKMKRGDPLTITLHDGGTPRLALRFDDWSQQVSTAISPTAGWGLPQNEVMFARQTSALTSGLFLSLTLASTSTGRGFDSVGHAAGVYRNRMVIQPLNTSE